MSSSDNDTRDRNGRDDDNNDQIRQGVRRAFRLDVIGPEARTREADEEIAFHLEMRVEQLVKRGMTPEAARTEALTRFAGGENELASSLEQLHVKPVRRGARERTAEHLEHLRRDVKFALRSLLRAPAFTILAVMTLSLGIGASTAIFSVVRGIVLRPLPYAEPSELYNVRHESMSTVAPATFLDWQQRSRSFEQMSAAEWWSPSVGGKEGASEIDAIRVTANHLPMLGVRMTLGRAFLPDEGVEPTQATVLSHGYWQSHFGGSPDVIGQSIILNGRAHTIVGVMPPRTPFVPFWADKAQLAVPLVFGARTTDREGASLRVFGRLRDGASSNDAAAEFAVIGEQMLLAFPGSDTDARFVGLHEMVVGNVRNVLYGVMVAVTCVLLIACANVAHLQLMRNAARGREFAIRTAIGGSRGHLLWQSLIEGMLLTGVACIAGLLLARLGVDGLVAFAPSSIPRVDSVDIDVGVIAFAAALSALVALFFALLPAITMKSRDLQQMLRDGGTSGEGRRRVRTRGLLVMSEFAMALVLLTTAGLVVKTVRAMHEVNPGFDPSNVLALRMSTRGTEDSTPARREAFFRRVVDRVSSMRGVEVAGAINHLPLHGDQWRFPYIAEGLPATEENEGAATFRVTRPGYFDAMRIELLEGRALTSQDAQAAARVVVVSKSLAARRWPGESAIGKRISVDGAARPEWFTIVGVAEDTRQGSWTEEPADEMYFPNIVDMNPANARRLVSMLNPQYLTLVVRTNVEPLSLANEITAAIHEINPNAAVSGVTSMEEVIESEFAVTRFYLTLFGAFATAAVSLALIGVYSVLSYSVARRRRELGVRLALGANRTDTFTLVLREGMGMVAGGAFIGIGASLLLSQLIRGLLYGVEPADLPTMVIATALVAAIAALGCAIPAWRAAQTNPLVALRES